MNRSSVDCQTKYAGVRDRAMKHGHFTLEEDQLIVRRVAEWGTRGKGLWPALEIEMDRPRSSLKTRYSKLRGEPPLTAEEAAMQSTSSEGGGAGAVNAPVRKVYWT